MRKAFLLALLLLPPGLALAQAGRFILAVGDVAVLRGATELRAGIGTSVDSGDTIRVGVNSNAQIRLSDESIIGLRPGTVLRLDEYAYSGAPDGKERNIFSLIKGGFRTVTGAIGRLQSRERYQVRTATSTIGIRGTHYTVVVCDNDCDASGNPTASGGQTTPGAGAANGTYGGVTDGRIAVENATGERLFGANEYFYVANQNAAPQGLIAPPSFLYDRLAGQSRNQGQKGQETSENMAQSGMNAESRPSDTPVPPTPNEFIVTEQKTATGSSAVLATGRTDLAFGFSQSNLNHDTGDSHDAGAQSSLVLDSTGKILESATGPDTFTGSTYSLSRNGAGVADLGGDASVGEVSWGRWLSGSTITTSDKGTVAPGTGIHWIFGAFAPHSVVAARTGSATYSHIGGTNPTNGAGAVGSMSSASFGVNFTTQQINGSIAYSVGGVSFTLSMPNVGITNVNGRAIFGHAPGNVGGFCSPCTGNGAWSVGGTFTGPQGNGIIATWATQHPSASPTAGAGFFKCTSGSC